MYIHIQAGIIYTGIHICMYYTTHRILLHISRIQRPSDPKGSLGPGGRRPAGAKELQAAPLAAGGCCLAGKEPIMYTLVGPMLDHVSIYLPVYLSM